MNPAEFHILLALAQGPRHGYGLMKKAVRESNGSVRLEIGSLYRVLARGRPHRLDIAVALASADRLRCAA